MVLADFGTGQVFLSMLFFFLFVAWIWLIFAVLTDVLTSADLSGWGKAAWSLLVIVLPFVGVFAYLVVRGSAMSEHTAVHARRRDAIYRDHVGKITV